MQKRAVGYIRTSSLTNVGEGKDSIERQKEAIQKYADSVGISVEYWYKDLGVSGSIPVNERDGFSYMLNEISNLGINTVIVEDANRFARDLIVQLVGHDMLCADGIELIAANSPEHFKEDTATAMLVRQVLGAIAQYEKTQLVNRLKAARERKIARGERGVGRKSLAEKLDKRVVEAVKRLRGIGWSYGKIAKYMQEHGENLSRDQISKIVTWTSHNSE